MQSSNGRGTSRNGFVAIVMLTTLACAGPPGKQGEPGRAGDAGPVAGAADVMDYGVLTPAELEPAKISATLSDVTIPADGSSASAPVAVLRMPPLKEKKWQS